MLIYTIQFPAIKLKNRYEFLSFTQREVVELALRNKELFLQKQLNAEYFHKDKSGTNKVPVRIHAIIKDGFYSLRAYGEEAVESLRLWFSLFMETHAHLDHHLIECLEHWQLQTSKTPQYYYSNNWIPFNNCAIENNVFFDKSKEEQNKSNALQSRLIGNLRSFFAYINIDNTEIDTRVKLCKYPKKSHKQLALTKNISGKVNEIYKYAFTVCMESNVILPQIFSLGQNVSYGNGLFVSGKKP